MGWQLRPSPLSTQPNPARTLFISGSFTVVVESRSARRKLVLCKDNSETFRLRTDVDFSHLRQTIPATWNKVTFCNRLETRGRWRNDLWLLSSDGVHRAAADQSDSATIRFSPWGEIKQSLTSNLISAMSVDSEGRLWAGTFRNGIDVLGSSGRWCACRIRVAREVNSLVEDVASKKMLAASSAGLLSFDANLGTTEHCPQPTAC
jgi:hypothetical protein